LTNPSVACEDMVCSGVRGMVLRRWISISSPGLCLASPAVLSNGVPPPGFAHHPVSWFEYWSSSGVWLCFLPTESSSLCFSKELTLVLRVRIRVESGLASRVVGAVSSSVVAYFGVHPFQWCSGLMAASPG